MLWFVITEHCESRVPWEWFVITEHCEGRVPRTSPTVHGERTTWCLEADPAGRTHCRHWWLSLIYQLPLCRFCHMFIDITNAQTRLFAKLLLAGLCFQSADTVEVGRSTEAELQCLFGEFIDITDVFQDSVNLLEFLVSSRHSLPCTVWVKKIPPPWNLLTFFPKRLGIFSPNFTCLLRIPIYIRLHIFMQLSATLTKLCHNKRYHHNVLKMFTIVRNARWVVALNMA